MPLNLDLKRGFNTFCQSTEAYCLNALIYRDLTKSLFRPISGH